MSCWSSLVNFFIDLAIFPPPTLIDAVGSEISLIILGFFEVLPANLLRSIFLKVGSARNSQRISD